MNILVLLFSKTIFIGLGATLVFDLWALFLKHAFMVTPSNFCLVGRWLRYIPDGIFRHSNIASVQTKHAECAIGWLARYMIGMIFAAIFIAFVGNGWIQHPTPIPALSFGVFTVVAPFFIMQPAFGLGFAASRMSNPVQARLRSLMNHVAFGVGLYLFGLLLDWLT